MSAVQVAARVRHAGASRYTVLLLSSVPASVGFASSVAPRAAACSCARRGDPEFPGRLEDTVGGAKHRAAIDIVRTVFDDLQTCANPTDDVSLVGIKKL